jgi:hypothetical protein
MSAREVIPLQRAAARFVIDARRLAPGFTIYSFDRRRDDRGLNPDSNEGRRRWRE